MSGRRSPEQVHEEDGHATAVSSCSLCQAEPTGAPVVVGEPGPEPIRFASGGVITSGKTYSVGPDGSYEEPPETFIRMEDLPKRRGQCAEPGCANKGTHRDGRCCGCHCRPGRTA